MCCTDTKENEIFLIQYKEIKMGSGAKIDEEGLPNIWGKAQIFHNIMKRLLVIYDFAPDPSEFPYIWGKFYFIFYQCVFLNQSMNFQKILPFSEGKKWIRTQQYNLQPNEGLHHVYGDTYCMLHGTESWCTARLAEFYNWKAQSPKGKSNLR